jgi:tetratricopeptide (TPR) repeat protein
MKTHGLLVLICFSFLAPSLFAQTAVTAPAAIPEEARKHFVMGETMFKEAKSADNFSQAAKEFTEAARLAPQWPEARYNLALAKEAAGDYAGAIVDLKLYQQFKLSDAEARTVQDRIYAIEAKQQLKMSDATAKASADAALAKAQERQFEGKWFYSDSNQFIEILGLFSARLSEGFDVIPSGNGFTVKGSSSLSGFQIRGRNVTFTATADSAASLNGRLIRNDHGEYDYDLTISEDGKTLSGTMRTQSSANGTKFPTTSVACKFSRHD